VSEASRAQPFLRGTSRRIERRNRKSAQGTNRSRQGSNRHEQRRGVRSEQRQAAADRSDAGLALSSAVHLRRGARAGRPGLAGRHSCPSVSVQAGTGRLFCAPVWRRPAVRTRVNGFGSPRRMAHSAAATHGHPPGRRRCRAQTKAHTPLPSRGRIPGAAPLARVAGHRANHPAVAPGARNPFTSDRLLNRLRGRPQAARRSVRSVPAPGGSGRAAPLPEGVRWSKLALL